MDPVGRALLVRIDHGHFLANDHKEVLLSITCVKLALRHELHLPTLRVKDGRILFSQIHNSVELWCVVWGAPVVTRFTNLILNEPCNHVSWTHGAAEPNGEPAVIRYLCCENELLLPLVITGFKAEIVPTFLVALFILKFAFRFKFWR